MYVFRKAKTRFSLCMHENKIQFIAFVHFDPKIPIYYPGKIYVQSFIYFTCRQTKFGKMNNIYLNYIVFPKTWL